MIGFFLEALLAQIQPDSSNSPASPDPQPSAAVRGRMPATFPPVAQGAAIIANSGSTNSAAYTLVIAPDGATTVRQYDGFTQKVVAPPQTRWLFAKLEAAGSLAAVGSGHCMKSASFGTSTTITWKGATSADVSCADDATSRELVRTIGVIVTQLSIGTLPRRRRLHTL